MTSNLPTDELFAWIRLSLEPGLGPVRSRALLSAIGLPQDVYASSAMALSKLVPAGLAQQLHRPLDEATHAMIARTLDWLQHPGHHLLTLADPAYPPALLDIHDPPLLLYVNGEPARLSQPAISIVGARSATAAGIDNALEFARYLASQGWCIISGLALGIDAAAHTGALRAGDAGGGTIAVLGTGIDIVYPSRNRELAHDIARHGALVSEFPLGTRALPHQFPRRNRVVAGLARGVLVVEAAKHSGSLITARFAAEMGREVFAIPGSIHSPLARGCHALIRQGAKLVESAQDINDELGLPRPDGVATAAASDAAAAAATPSTAASAAAAARSASRRVRPVDHPAHPDHAALLAALGFDPVHLDTLQHRTGLDLGTLTTRLLELELNETVARLDDGRFQRC